MWLSSSMLSIEHDSPFQLKFIHIDCKDLITLNQHIAPPKTTSKNFFEGYSVFCIL